MSYQNFLINVDTKSGADRFLLFTQTHYKKVEKLDLKMKWHFF